MIDRLIVTDIETMGLDPDVHPIIEIGFVIFDLDFKVLDQRECLVWDSPMYDKAWEDAKKNPYVLDMHEKSGAVAEARQTGLSVEEANADICGWLEGHGVGNDANEPMVGSSVHFDRSMFDAQMPEISSHFHYRNIDVSTLKELCRRFNPELYLRLEAEVTPVKAHRVISDCLDTARELQFYTENFIFDGRPVE